MGCRLNLFLKISLNIFKKRCNIAMNLVNIVNYSGDGGEQDCEAFRATQEICRPCKEGHCPDPGSEAVLVTPEKIVK